MKLIVAVLMMILGICNADFIHHNGQPGCKTDQELNVKNFRNNWDPTAFWLCEVKGQAATRAKCPDGLAWLDSSKDCVEWSEWVWEKPANPLSQPS